MTNNLSTLRYDKISSSYPKVWTISQLPLQTAEDVNYLATTPTPLLCSSRLELYRLSGLFCPFNKPSCDQLPGSAQSVKLVAGGRS